MECTTCGRQLPANAKFCGSCGSPARSSEVPLLTNDAPEVAPDTEPAPAEATRSTPGEHSSPRAAVTERGSAWTTSPGSAPATGKGQGSSPLTALLLAVGGLALIIGAQSVTYAFVDDYDSAKPMLILLLLIGLAGAGAGTGITASRARPQLEADAPVSASMLAFTIGVGTLAYGVLRVLTSVG